MCRRKLSYGNQMAKLIPDLESGTFADATIPVVHAAHLLVAAGWPLPKGDMLAPPAVYLALLVLRAWTGALRSSATGAGLSPAIAETEGRLVAELMAPRATAAPHVGPHGMLPDTQGVVTPTQVLKLGLQWMATAGASGYAQRLARLLDREEG